MKFTNQKRVQACPRASSVVFGQTGLSEPKRWDKAMYKTLSFAALVVTLALAGCGYTPEQRATSGAGLGGATGAALGAATGGGVGAALAGGVLGAATGAIVGANTRPPPPPPPPVYYPAPPPPARCERWGNDAYGNPVCVRYFGYRKLKSENAFV